MNEQWSIDDNGYKTSNLFRLSYIGIYSEHFSFVRNGVPLNDGTNLVDFCTL